jgi:hypothetical protein
MPRDAVSSAGTNAAPTHLQPLPSNFQLPTSARAFGHHPMSNGHWPMINGKFRRCPKGHFMLVVVAVSTAGTNAAPIHLHPSTSTLLPALSRALRPKASLPGHSCLGARLAPLPQCPQGHFVLVVAREFIRRDKRPAPGRMSGGDAGPTVKPNAGPGAGVEGSGRYRLRARTLAPTW